MEAISGAARRSGTSSSGGFVAGQIVAGQRVVLAAIPIDQIEPNPNQPRRFIDPAALDELTDSVRRRGVLQPIIVKRQGDSYLIMAGERRYRAACKAGLTVMPAIIRDDDPSEIALIENLQREDLTALEEAEGLEAMVARYGYTHQELAHLLHKSRPYVSNMLVLTRLPSDVKAELHGHPTVSREILMAIARQDSPEGMLQLWKRVKLSNLSVHRFRETRREPDESAILGEVLNAARRLNRKLGDLDLSRIGEDERKKLGRVLRRTRKRVEAALAAG